MMARSRNIKPGLAKNEVLAELGPHAQLLFALLPCLADREGRLEDRPKRIKAELFPYYEVDVDGILDALATCSEAFVVRYEIDGTRYLQITNFERHQSPHHKESESIIPACSKQESCLSQAIAKHDNPSRKGKGIRNQVKGIKEEESGRQNQFVGWWESVHLKKGKAEAEKAYAKAVTRLRKENSERDPHAFLLDRMRAFAASPEARPPDREPIHPATWLNKGRYDDDESTWHKSSKPKGLFA